MIVITGAAGFIGSNFVATLNEMGVSQIAICDFFETGEKWRNLAKAAFVDVIPPALLLDWLRRQNTVQAVIHMAAISATTATDGDLVMDTNFRLSVALLDHCAAANIPLMFASSASVYGNGDGGFDDDISCAGVLNLRPLNLYGWSKRQFDYVVADRIERGAALPPTCVGLRFFNVFGPNEYHKQEMMSIVAKIADPISRGESITLFKSHRDGVADGDQRRDFVYVKDAVEAAMSLLKSGQTGIFNVGTGVARSFRELAEATFAAYGRPPQIEYVDMPAGMQPKYQYFTEAKIGRLRASGYQTPFAPLEVSVAAYVEGYLGREDRYR